VGQGVLRVYQEDWFPFQNLPRALRAFTEATGIRTELVWDTVGVGTIEHMFDEMIQSFESDAPRYDLICSDEVILREMAKRGRAVDLAARMRRDGITLGDVTESSRHAVTIGDQVLGLPCVNVSSMVLYRRDLLDRYGFPVPQNWTELRDIAGTLQAAVRRDEDREFYGFETRGAAGGGHAVWTIGSFIGSHGASWLNEHGELEPIGDGHHAAFDTYLRLLREVSPPDQGDISFVEMRRDFASGRVGMIMDVGMEYAHVLANIPELADKAGVAMVPAGPTGRAPNLYCPPYAIPIGSDMKDEAWELAKYLSSPRQQLEDGTRSNAVEAASLSVLYSSEFDHHFRADLLATVRASRAVAKEERPFDMGIAASEVIGDAAHAALVDGHSTDELLQRIESGLRELSGG